MHGVLVIDKPGGMTSAAVVSHVKRTLGAGKVGHTGTLDPLATGVLPLCLGEGTKIAGYLLAADKEYEGELLLGSETDTLDREGRELRSDASGAAGVDEASLRSAMKAMLGPREQRPPMYSAVKHRGRRLHELARAGQEVDRASRPVNIHDFKLLDADLPRARFRVSCSKGTYVRVLVSELGSSLGCGAHLRELRRTRAGAFALASALTLDELEGAAERLVDPAAALGHLPAALVPPALERAISDGQKLRWDDAFEGAAPGGLVRLLSERRSLLALVTVVAGRLDYSRVFRYGLTSALRSDNLPRCTKESAIRES